MSKDQLSWDQLLNSKGEVSEVAQASNSVPGQTAAQPSGQTADRTVTVEYSKKDWSKLEIPTPTPMPTKSTVTHAEAKVKKTVEKLDILLAQDTPADSEIDDALEADVEPNSEPHVMTVSELNKSIRDILEGKFPLLWLKGEISNFKAHTSGHFYFSLKDDRAQISAVMFRGFNSQLRFRPEDGMEVLIRGKITVYEPRGNYQIFCELMEPVGAGALQKAYEQLKAKLQKEGLFDESRKRRLPTLPKHIAIVTSPTGAAIRDMLNILGRRFKGANITVIPCKVQGDQAPKEIIQAIELANRLDDVEVMIVGRGGGSIEDLWAFNDEGVARAIASARVPVISAVGHEVDFTIADFVADLRAPTPSAAAELVVKNAADLIERISNLRRALQMTALRHLNDLNQAALALSRRLVDPQRRIQDASIRCDELMQRLEYATLRSVQDRRLRIELLRQKLGTPKTRIEHKLGEVVHLTTRLKAVTRNLLQHKKERLSKNMAVLDSLSPLKVLDRGYSMVVSEENQIITDATELAIGQTVKVRMCQGSIEAKVSKIEKIRK